MKWIVYIHDWNSNEIIKYNCLEYYSKDFLDIYKKSKDFKSFSERIRIILMNRYWCRYEYEVEIMEYCDNPKVGKRVDVFDQIVNNWDVFIKYVYEETKKLYENNHQ